MRPVSVGTRWAIRFSVAMFGTLLALAALGHRLVESWTEAEAKRQLEHYLGSVSEIVGRNVGEPIVVSALIESIIAGSPSDSEIAIEIYDLDGVVRLRRDILAPFGVDPNLSKASDTGATLFTKSSSDTRLEGLAVNSAGFTRVSMSLVPFAQMLTSFRVALVLLLLAGVVMTGFLGAWQARLSLRPLAEMVTTARKIDTIGGDQWIPTSGNGDELDVLSNTLNEMLERIRAGMDRMRRFATQAAHELNTPLGASRTTIEVTLEHERSPREYRAALHGLLANTELLSEAVHAILDIARSEAGLSAERIEEVDLHDLLESVVEFFEPLAQEQGVEMAPIHPFRATVRGDRMWLRRLLASLLDNAVKYSRRGDHIGFAYQQRGGICELEVRDTGIGIMESDRSRIFERFYRGDSDRSRSLGLGLPLAMEIARAHAGTIEVENPEVGGSTFRVCLPLSAEAGREAA